MPRGCTPTSNRFEGEFSQQTGVRFEAVHFEAGSAVGQASRRSGKPANCRTPLDRQDAGPITGFSRETRAGVAHVGPATGQVIGE